MKQSYHFLMILFIFCFTSKLYSQSLPSYVPTNGLVGWWGFNVNAQDGSGNGNHGTVNGDFFMAVKIRWSSLLFNCLLFRGTYNVGLEHPHFMAICLLLWALFVVFWRGDYPHLDSMTCFYEKWKVQFVPFTQLSSILGEVCSQY